MLSTCLDDDQTVMQSNRTNKLADALVAVNEAGTVVHVAALAGRRAFAATATVSVGRAAECKDPKHCKQDLHLHIPPEFLRSRTHAIVRCHRQLNSGNYLPPGSLADLGSRFLLDLLAGLAPESRFYGQY